MKFSVSPPCAWDESFMSKRLDWMWDCCCNKGRRHGVWMYAFKRWFYVEWRSPRTQEVIHR